VPVVPAQLACAVPDCATSIAPLSSQLRKLSGEPIVAGLTF